MRSFRLHREYPAPTVPTPDRRVKRELTGRALLTLSLLANLVLAGVWWSARAIEPLETIRGQTVPPTRTAGNSSSVARPLVTGNDAHRPTGARFHWSMLESEDYRVYIANLRAVGCPEAVLGDLIAAELTQHYNAERRSRQLALPYWACGATRRAAATRARAEDASLTEEREAVFSLLMGRSWPDEERDDWTEVGLAEFLFGFLSPDRRDQFVHEIRGLERVLEGVRVRADQILLPADQQELLEVFHYWQRELARHFASWEIQEAGLRLALLEDSLDFGDQTLEDFELTGAELREFYQIHFEGLDPLLRVYVDPSDLEEVLAAQPAAASEANLREDPIL